MESSEREKKLMIALLATREIKSAMDLLAMHGYVEIKHFLNSDIEVDGTLFTAQELYHESKNRYFRIDKDGKSEWDHLEKFKEIT